MHKWLPHLYQWTVADRCGHRSPERPQMIHAVMLQQAYSMLARGWCLHRLANS